MILKSSLSLHFITSCFWQTNKELISIRSLCAFARRARHKYKSEEPLPSYSVVGSSSAFGISSQRVSPLLQLQISISTWNLDAAGCCLLYHYVTFSNNYEIQRHFISLFEMPASDLDLICWLLIVHPAYILLYLNFKTGSFTSLYDLITETYWLHDVGLMVAWHCCSYQMGHIRSSLLILGRSQC